MSTPFIPVKNGKKVTTSQFSWEQMCIQAWGEEWNKPDTAYEFSNGKKKDSTDRYTTGIYRKT